MLSSVRSSHGIGAIAVALVVAEALLGACSAVGSNAGTEGFSDAGAGGDTGSGGGDATTDASGEAGFDTGTAIDGATAPTTALLVQASPSLPDVRLCWATGGVKAPVLPFPADGHMPGSNYPGVPLGGVAAMADAAALVGTGVTLYAVDAENLARLEQGQASPSTCDELICGQGSNQMPPCLRYNLDYWPVLTIASGGVRGARDNVVALAGCLPAALDPNASTALCGATWTPVDGNLHADVVQLSKSPAGQAMAVQAAQLSPSLAIVEGDGGSALVSFGAQDAAGAIPVATLSGEGDLGVQTVVSLEGGLPAYGQLGFAVDVAGADGGPGHAWMSLAESQQLVDPTVDPTQFFGQHRTVPGRGAGRSQRTSRLRAGDGRRGLRRARASPAGHRRAFPRGRRGGGRRARGRGGRRERGPVALRTRLRPTRCGSTWSAAWRAERARTSSPAGRTSAARPGRRRARRRGSTRWSRARCPRGRRARPWGPSC